jgi:hypothetical protein
VLIINQFIPSTVLNIVKEWRRSRRADVLAPGFASPRGGGIEGGRWKPVPTSSSELTRPLTLRHTQDAVIARPLVGSVMAHPGSARILNRVDLPAPLRPMPVLSAIEGMPTTSPRSTSKETSLSAQMVSSDSCHEFGELVELKLFFFREIRVIRGRRFESASRRPALSLSKWCRGGPRRFYTVSIDFLL